MKLQPLNDKIVVKREEAEDKTAGPAKAKWLPWVLASTWMVASVRNSR
jgi:hypothetical protein